MASASAPLLDDDTLGFGEEEELRSKSLTHPYVTFFHLVFRISAIIVYMLCGWFKISFIASFVTVVLLLSMDFWTVKNITGRLMVGLRWWNYVDDDGKSHWIYEARKALENTNALVVVVEWNANEFPVVVTAIIIWLSEIYFWAIHVNPFQGNLQNRVNSSEAQIFWLALILCPVMWCIFFLIALFGLSLKWLLLVCISLVLNGANLYGYVKCKLGNKESVGTSISNATSEFFRKQVIQNVTSFITRSSSQPKTNVGPTNVI